MRVQTKTSSFLSFLFSRLWACATEPVGCLYQQVVKIGIAVAVYIAAALACAKPVISEQGKVRPRYIAYIVQVPGAGVFIRAHIDRGRAAVAGVGSEQILHKTQATVEICNHVYGHFIIVGRVNTGRAG